MKSILIILMLLCVAVLSEEKSADWKPLFDGKTLGGWHIIGKGEWSVEDGAIVGKNVKSSDYGHLVSDAEYIDFAIRLKFKSMKGNSGLYFRIVEKGSSGVTGFQAEIDPRNDIGGLYETNGRSWVVKPTADDIKNYFKPDDWNEMIVTAKGGNVTVEINGQKSAELKDDKGRLDGRFALQVHGGQEVLVYFKDLSIQGTPK